MAADDAEDDAVSPSLRVSAPVTHHVWYDQPGGKRALAVCGASVLRRDSVAQPTCPVCRGLLAAHDAKLKTLLPDA